MSSKRGRKRNDNLPPNRARDVQRAFRARRAAHLQALEQRVSELEEENSCLRQALNLPPANRLPLGKGPTGKDKPKPLEHMAESSAIAMSSGRASPDGDSPASRTSSLSPCTLTVAMPSRSTPVIESGSWDDAMLLSDQQSDVSGQPYGIAMSAPSPLKPLHQYGSYISSSLPSSRNSVTSLYLASTTQYSAPSDRPSNPVYNGHSYPVRNDMGSEAPRQLSSYSHSTFQTTEVEMHAQTPPPNVPIPQSNHREASMPYPHRRSQTEPQGYSVSEGYLHLTLPAHVQQNSRNPEYPQLLDGNGQTHTHPNLPSQPHHSSRPIFGGDGRMNTMS